MGYVTQENLSEFKREYQKAAKKKRKKFMFNGDEILTAYAKYVLIYIKSLTEKGMCA